MSAFNMLSGWQASLRHMFSADRLPFTTAYIGSMLATLYGALVMKSYVLSIVFSGAQVRRAACRPGTEQSAHNGDVQAGSTS